MGTILIFKITFLGRFDLDLKDHQKVVILGSTTTDREQTDHGQRRLTEKGDPKYIFTIHTAILPKPSLRDEITVTKSSLRGQFVAIS